jgi:phospholipid/cholesterol/gamma-HCH transport system permease protein
VHTSSAMAPLIIESERSPDGTLRLALSGDWVLGGGIPPPGDVVAKLDQLPLPRRVALDARSVGQWDTGLLTFLLPVAARCAELGVEVDRGALPQGVTRLLALATAVPARRKRRGAARAPALARVGDAVLAWWSGSLDALAFVGEAFLSVVRLAGRTARFRRSDLLLALQDCGARSLPIVSLISLLVGLILAFVGAIQLRTFGAQIYVSHLVGIATVREIGAIMTGIIVTGRTGASFAAQLGTMQVNEEIDALRTFGLRPMDFLVLPRLLALSLMMPLLCLYADLMGILGGLVVGVTMLDIHPLQYLLETERAIHLADVLLGLFMSAVFGVIVALTGCMRGMESGRSASAVGEATTSAVVTGIVSIVVATAVITYGAYVLGI